MPGAIQTGLGFGNSFRSLPKDMPANLNQYETATNPEIQNKITDLGKELNKTWVPVSANARPDQRVSLGFNKRFNLVTVLWKYYFPYIQQYK